MLIIKKDIAKLSPIEKTEGDNSRMMFTNLIRNMSHLIGNGCSEREFYVNVGVSSDNTYVDKLMSTAVVADYIYRVVMSQKQGKKNDDVFKDQNKNIVHPLSVLIDPDLNILRLPANIRQQIKSTYNFFCVKIEKGFGCKIDKYTTFEKKYCEARCIIHRFATILKENKVVTGTAKHITQYIKDHINILSELLKRRTKSRGFHLSDLTYEKYKTLCCTNDTKGKNINSKISSGSRAKKGKRNITGLATARKKPHLQHQREDINIPKETPLVKNPKPGSDNCSHQQIPQNSDLNIKKNFDGEAKKHQMKSETPVIVIETFKNDKSEIVCGITTKQEKQQKPGGDYVRMKNKNKKLHGVIICPTTPSYVYFFRHAELRPHFVTSREKLKGYLLKIVTEDIKITKFCDDDLNEPIKIISDHSISEGLRAGNQEESEFYFFSERTEVFKTLMNDDRLQFDLDKLMKKYDEETALSNITSDELSRGFVDGHTDIGFTREGALTNTINSQTKSGEHVCARPVIFGSDSDLKLLGNIPDAISEIMDRYCFENNCKLMPDDDRDEMFAAVLRSKIGLKKSRFEAYTIVRQFISRLKDFDPSCFNETTRHVDGPNCFRPGYRHTAVFSFMCVWKKVSIKSCQVKYIMKIYSYLNFFFNC